MQRVKDMLADLNALLAAHARNEDTTDAFADFMAKHGEFFPEQPETIEELIDALARRQAAAQRMLASLSPGAARTARPADEPGAGRRRPRLPDGPAERQPARPPARSGPRVPDRDAAGRRVARLQRGGRGGGRAGRPRGAAGPALAGEMPAPPWTTSTSTCWSKRLGAEAVRDFRALRDLERELEQQGFLTRGDDGLRLTPRAVRRLGQTALRRVFAQLEAAGHGDHDDRRTGAADEPTGLTRPWVFGDELPIDAPRTVANALRRDGLGATRCDAEVDDFEVTETERRTSRRRSRSASICRSRWCRTAAGGR